MRNGNIAIIIDTDNAATTELRADLAEAMKNKDAVYLCFDWTPQDVPFHITDFERTEITEDNRGRQDVFILSMVDDPK